MDEAKQGLLSMSDHVFQRTRGRLDGLEDEEYVWEPVPACWSVRRRSDGTHRIDHAVRPEFSPFTTVAWRLWHLTCCYGQRKNATWLGVAMDAGGRFEMDAEVPATAAAALSCLEDAHGHWRAVVDALSDDDLDTPLGPGAGPYAEQKKTGFVLHMLDEFIHHGAELGVLRDLWRGQRMASEDPLLELLGGCPDALHIDADADAQGGAESNLLSRAVRNGFSHAVPLLLGLGFRVDDRLDEATGASILHLAAASGDVDAVRLLVEHGADPTQCDRRFGVDAKAWAEYYGRKDVVEYLTGLAR